MFNMGIQSKNIDFTKNSSRKIQKEYFNGYKRRKKEMTVAEKKEKLKVCTTQ
jgi:hypothetical protein